MSLGLFVENVEKDQCVGSIFRNQFRFLLMNHPMVLLYQASEIPATLKAGKIALPQSHARL
jgi:hypothetical protein